MIRTSKIALVVVAACLSLSASAGRVEQRLQRQIERIPVQETLLSEYRISRIIKAVVNVTKANDDRFKCEETTFIKNSDKFKTSYDADGNPCRIYDLSFPTLLRGSKGGKQLTSVPLKKFAPEVYEKWLDGDYDYVSGKTQEYVDHFSPATYNNSWVKRLPFKRKMNEDKSGIIKSFKLSDLRLRKFQFTAYQRGLLKQLFARAHKSADLAKFEVFVDQPEKFLDKIKFNWNDLKKVYDVLLEFDFLPLRGPVVLVDYNAQYKFMVERMIRTAVKRALLFITEPIPNKNVRRLITLAINESFDFLDMAYMYHLNQLENTLRLNLEGVVPTDIKRAELDKGMNILFASQGSLLTQYIMGLATGQQIDLEKLDAMGKATRYSTEKQRLNTMRNLFSNLTIKKHCTMKRVSRYFGECLKENQNRYLYSLLASHKVLIWDLGATQIHDYQSPAKISLMRKTAYLLSSALNIFRISLVPEFITDNLVKILRDYSVNGILEEGVLLNELTEKARVGNTTDEEQYLIKWLFKQNINPFLVNSLQTENRLIDRASAE